MKWSIQSTKEHRGVDIYRCQAKEQTHPALGQCLDNTYHTPTFLTEKGVTFPPACEILNHLDVAFAFAKLCSAK